MNEDKQEIMPFGTVVFYFLSILAPCRARAGPCNLCNLIFLTLEGISQPKGAVYARIVLALIVSTQNPTNRIFFES